MSNIQQIIDNIISESLSKRADELSEKIFSKIESNEDVDKYDLEVGMDYGFDDDDEDYTFMRRGKHSSHGPFHFKRNKRGGDVAFGEKKIANMKKRIKEQSEKYLDLAIGLQSMEEEEVEEGNAFTGALAKAKKEGKKSFKVDGKEFEVTEDLGGMGDDMGPGDEWDVNLGNKDDEKVQRLLKKYMRHYDNDINDDVDQNVDFVTEAKNKWIQDTKMNKGSLHKKLNVPQDEKIPVSKLKSLKKELSKKAEGDKKLSKSDLKLSKEVNLALTLGDIKKESIEYRIRMSDGDFLDLTESELVDMIEELVTEEKVKDNLKKTGKPAGLVQYDKVSKKDKAENSKANEESIKKMTDYVEKSGGSKGKFTSNPVMFPKGNGELAKMDKEAYTPSEYVNDYVDAFAYPGQTNIVFDEIKPDDKKIEMYLKGDRLTGNAQVDDEGNPLGNVVPSELGEKMFKNYKDNLYGAEQLDASYKRQSQPVDIAGKTTQKGKLTRGKNSSAAKAQKVLDNVDESISNEKSSLLNEEMENMKKLIGYQYKK